MLSADPGGIYLADLIEIFQGPFILNECIFKKRACPNQVACVLHRKIRTIEKRVAGELEAINIASLVRKGG